MPPCKKTKQTSQENLLSFASAVSPLSVNFFPYNRNVFIGQGGKIIVDKFNI